MANITAWPDWNRDRAYNPAMKPWLVGKWLTATRYDGPIHIIDPDVIPTGHVKQEAENEVLHGTDTDHYTGPAWLDSKGALEPLCDLVELTPDIARLYLGIGAQYIFKGIPGSWWEYVAETSIKAYRLLKHHPVDAQPWCAEMYVTHLCAIRDGYRPSIAPSMGMVWADGPRNEWDRLGYFHDAGITKPRPGAFHKGSHQSWPKEIPDVDSNHAASLYVDLIRETERAWPELVKLFP